MPRPSAISLVPTRHQAAAHQPARGRHCCWRPQSPLPRPESGRSRPGLCRKALVAEETQDDADGFFSHSTIDAGLCGQLSNQFVHIAPPSAGSCRVLACEFDLDRLRYELQAMTRMRDADLRSRSRRECCSNARVSMRIHATCRVAALDFICRMIGEEYENACLRGRESTRHAADGFNRRAGCSMIASAGDQTSPMRAKRRCDG